MRCWAGPEAGFRAGTCSARCPSSTGGTCRPPTASSCSARPGWRPCSSRARPAVPPSQARRPSRGPRSWGCPRGRASCSARPSWPAGSSRAAGSALRACTPPASSAGSRRTACSSRPLPRSSTPPSRAGPEGPSRRPGWGRVRGVRWSRPAPARRQAAGVGPPSWLSRRLCCRPRYCRPRYCRPRPRVPPPAKKGAVPREAGMSYKAAPHRGAQPWATFAAVQRAPWIVLRCAARAICARGAAACVQTWAPLHPPTDLDSVVC